MHRKYECTFHTLKNPELSSKTRLNPDNRERVCTVHRGEFCKETPSALVEGRGGMNNWVFYILSLGFLEY